MLITASIAKTRIIKFQVHFPCPETKPTAIVQQQTSPNPIRNLTGKGGPEIKTASGHTITSTDSSKFIIGKENFPVDIMED